MSDDGDWVLDVGAAHGSWEETESASYDLKALKAEYDAAFRKAPEVNPERREGDDAGE
jgi:hypothetical protein